MIRSSLSSSVKCMSGCRSPQINPDYKVVLSLEPPSRYRERLKDTLDLNTDMLKPSKSLFDDYGIASKKPVDAPDKRLATKTSKAKETPSRDRVDVLMTEIQEVLVEASKTLTDALAAIAPKINEIRNEKLYLKYADNFADFCQWKLGASKSLVYQSLKDLAVKESSDRVVQSLHSPILIKNDLRKPEPEIAPNLTQDMQDKPTAKQIRQRVNPHRGSELDVQHMARTGEIREPGFVERCDDIVIRLRSSRSMIVLDVVESILEEHGL